MYLGRSSYVILVLLKIISKLFKKILFQKQIQILKIKLDTFTKYFRLLLIADIFNYQSSVIKETLRQYPAGYLNCQINYFTFKLFIHLKL